mmetsp:Transcript_10757/g.37663  ORF Transcript_10757/g.37663 Transcript_10757/m.37663 type:complete len:80 (+) Transcript_10757:1868-2107(+)
MVGLLKLAASSAGLPCHQFISQASMKCRRALDCWVVRPTAPIAGLHAADSMVAVHVSPALSAQLRAEPLVWQKHKLRSA